MDEATIAVSDQLGETLKVLERTLGLIETLDSRVRFLEDTVERHVGHIAVLYNVLAHEGLVAEPDWGRE